MSVAKTQNSNLLVNSMDEEEFVIWTLTYTAAISARHPAPKEVADQAVEDFNATFTEQYVEPPEEGFDADIPI